MTCARSGIGTTLTFGTSGFTAKVRNYSNLGISRTVLDGTHMGSSAGSDFDGLIFREKCPGDLGETKELQIDILFDPDENTPPIDQPEETITLQFRPTAAQASGASFVFTGFMSDIDGTVPFDGEMSGTITIVPTGEPTWTAGVDS